LSLWAAYGIAFAMSSGNEDDTQTVLSPPRRSIVSKLFRVVVFLGLTGGVGALSVVGGTYLYFAPGIPQFDSLNDYQPKLGTRIYSADNQLIAEFAAERRVLVPSEKIPTLLSRAFIAAEDKRFYTHGGIDFLGVAQAILDKIRRPESKLRGASTITQQVAKSLLVANESYATATERTFTRKIREAILARDLEEKLTKDEILYLYLNQIFLGHKAYGVQAAAEHYFRKNVWELSLAEMATFAGLPQRPSDYSPFLRPDAAHARRRYVLRRMRIDGYISEAEEQEAAEGDLTVYPRRELYLQVAPYFTEQVRRILVDRYGEQTVLTDGLKVYSTMNVEYQKYGQMMVSKGLHELDKRQGYRGALAHLDPEDEKLKRLFVNLYRDQLGLVEGERIRFEKDRTYLALVTGIVRKGTQVKLDIAGEKGTLPLAGMRWARTPNPTRRVYTHYVRDAAKVLEVGDIITVSLTSRKELSKDIYGAEIMGTVPKKKMDLFRLEQEPIVQGALMSVDPKTGYVVAQVGGYNFEDSSFNRAVQACREPGSAFKPIVYSAAIDKLDYTPSTIIEDKPLVFDDPANAVRWKPNNAGARFRGEVPMRTCLKDSINTPAIRIASAVGIRDILRNARRLGIKSHLKRELGTALGSSCTTMNELINVYVTMNQYGLKRPLQFIRRVVDRDGNVIKDDSVPSDPMIDLATRMDKAYAAIATPPKRLLDKPTAFIMTSLLQNVVRNGTAVGASYLGIPVAGKTGTTNDSYDAWFMGFTPGLVTGVWVGHDKKERPLGVGEYGGKSALPIWVDFMGAALRNRTVDSKFKPMIDQGEFVPPPGVVQVSIDPESGLLARPDSLRAVDEYYREGTEPTEYTPDKVVIDPTEMSLFDADSPF